MQLHYVMDRATFVEASRALWEWGRRQKRVRVRSWLLAGALPATALLAWHYGMWFIFLAVVALAALHFVFDWPLTRTFARRGFRQLPIANKTIHWRIDHDGLQVRIGNEADAEEAHIRWNALLAVSEHATGFVLHQPHNVHHWLPRSALTDAQARKRLRALLQQHAPAFVTISN